MCKETGAALEYLHLKVGEYYKLWLGSASKEIGRLAQGSATVRARNRPVSSVFFPLHRFRNPCYPRLHRNKHFLRNRTRRCNGCLAFKFLLQQPQSKGKILCQRHATVRPYGRILPVRVKSAISRHSLFLSFYRRWRPSSARSKIKTSRTPQRRHPSHVNSHATGTTISSGSGGRRYPPPTKHAGRPWSRPGSYLDNNGQ